MSRRFPLVRWTLFNWLAGLFSFMGAVNLVPLEGGALTRLLPSVVLGIAQALVLQWVIPAEGRITRALLWIIAVVVGDLLGGMAAVFIITPVFGMIIVTSLLGGGLAGAAQALVLRGHHPAFQNIVGWTLASALGWALSELAFFGGILLIFFSSEPGESGSAVASAIGVALLLAGWVFYALVTGLFARQFDPGQPRDTADLPAAP